MGNYETFSGQGEQKLTPGRSQEEVGSYKTVTQKTYTRREEDIYKLVTTGNEASGWQTERIRPSNNDIHQISP